MFFVHVTSDIALFGRYRLPGMENPLPGRLLLQSRLYQKLMKKYNWTDSTSESPVGRLYPKGVLKRVPCKGAYQNPDYIQSSFKLRFN